MARRPSAGLALLRTYVADRFTRTEAYGPATFAVELPEPGMLLRLELLDRNDGPSFAWLGISEALMEGDPAR